jgi:hypothetical protein
MIFKGSHFDDVMTAMRAASSMKIKELIYEGVEYSHPLKGDVVSVDINYQTVCAQVTEKGVIEIQIPDCTLELSKHGVVALERGKALTISVQHHRDVTLITADFDRDSWK